MPNIEAKVAAEQVRVIYRQAIPAQAISVFIAAVVAAVVWDVTDHGLIIGWLITIGAIAVTRVALVWRFPAHGADTTPAVWERSFVLSLAATGVTWGVGGWLVMPAQSLLHQAVVYFFLMGMAGGAVASYAAHSTAAIIAIGGVMLPSTVWLALQDGLIPRAMAIGGVVYMAAAYRATRTLAFFLRRSFQLSYELQQSREAAEALARTDELTGLRNRRAFYELGELALAQATRYGSPMAMVLLDIDRFKSVNDTFGHAAGDRAIKAVAAAITATARAADISGRLGGDEFAILLPQTIGEDAVRQAERLQRALAVQQSDGWPGHTLTCSVGVAERGPGVPTLDAMLKQADGALYEAKREGRNRVILRR